MSGRRTTSRDVGLAVAIFAAGTGVVTGSATVFMVSVVGLLYSAYQAAVSEPEPTLTVERTVETTTPLPGSTVEVTVTVRNDGLSYLPDVRIVDGVPERLEVVDGSPRFGTALAVDESDSFRYAVAARRGEHPFGETTVICRNLSGTSELSERVTVETSLDCSAAVDTFELASQTLSHTGRVPTDAGGDGVAFYAIREHQSTDPMSRIDWNRLARTTELATVEFQETRAASVVVLIDDRHPVAPGPRKPTAVQYSTYAAEQIATALMDADNRVGAAVFDSCASLRPSAGRAQSRRLRDFFQQLVDGPDGVATRSDSWLFDDLDNPSFFQSVDDIEQRYGLTDGGDPVSVIDRKIPDDSQVIFCTPLLDDRAADAAERLSAFGHAVTVLSPDVTNTETPGASLAGFDRSERLNRLRGRIRVVDWTPEEPLAKALIRASERWSR